MGRVRSFPSIPESAGPHTQAREYHFFNANTRLRNISGTCPWCTEYFREFLNRFVLRGLPRSTGKAMIKVNGSS